MAPSSWASVQPAQPVPRIHKVGLSKSRVVCLSKRLLFRAVLELELGACCLIGCEFTWRRVLGAILVGFEDETQKR